MAEVGRPCRLLSRGRAWDPHPSFALFRLETALLPPSYLGRQDGQDGISSSSDPPARTLLASCHTARQHCPPSTQLPSLATKAGTLANGRRFSDCLSEGPVQGMA